VLLRGGITGLVLALVLHSLYVLLGTNFHTVIPGMIYRSAQPSGPRLEELVRKLGLRTVVNLRGCCDPLPWYLEQCRASNQLNLSQEDLGFSAGRLPSVFTVRQLIEVFDRSEHPILLHCHKGADRTGMASVMALLLYTNTPLEDARHQLGARYGHLPLGRTTHIDRFFDLYQEWLSARGLQHSPETFRRWALQDYCPGECRCHLEVLDSGGQPLHVVLGRPFPVRVRCTNTSIKPWQLRPGSNAGVHLHWSLCDDQGESVALGRSGLFHATVPPGYSIDLTLALPTLFRPGRYELRVDMMDEQHAAFLQTGSPLLVWEIVAP